MLAKRVAGDEEPSDAHVRFSKVQLNEMVGKAADEKAYVGFIPMTKGKPLTIRVWDKPWRRWTNESGYHDVVLNTGELYILPAEAVHTELCDADYEYMVMIITLPKFDDSDAVVAGSLQIEQHNLNFKKHNGTRLE